MPWYFQNEARRGWPVGMLNELKTIPAGAFEAVATQQLMVDPDSSQTRN